MTRTDWQAEHWQRLASDLEAALTRSGAESVALAAENAELRAELGACQVALAKLEDPGPPEWVDPIAERCQSITAAMADRGACCCARPELMGDSLSPTGRRCRSCGRYMQ